METLAGHDDETDLQPGKQQARLISSIATVLVILLLLISIITGVVVFQYYKVEPITMSCPP